jgi:hypothetical protein
VASSYFKLTDVMARVTMDYTIDAKGRVRNLVFTRMVADAFKKSATKYLDSIIYEVSAGWIAIGGDSTRFPQTFVYKIAPIGTNFAF